MTLSSKPVIETALAHRSIRKFTDEPISSEQLTAILNAGRAGSTSNFFQSTHIIRVTDPEVRTQIRDIGRALSSIDTCAELLIYCFNFAKHQSFAPESQLDWTEMVLIGAVDCGIIAQNVILAAESLGLGGVYLGYVRNDINRTAEILKLPKHVVPMFGMALGHPAQDPMLRPRLPLEAMVSENHYQPIDEQVLADYRALTRAYYQERSKMDTDWVEQMTESLKGEIRPEILPFLHKQGFAQK
ncbi:oxygen-insensitive NADPH nitroreductase [Neisseria sp. CCUG17229]|uniref:oxygen-insensitive NADPH nitroreductase n=1 Tax=Neisseria sp. CCUG17229 TaxID=3392036 RepID=UPI003A101E35